MPAKRVVKRAVKKKPKSAASSPKTVAASPKAKALSPKATASSPRLKAAAAAAAAASGSPKAAPAADAPQQPLRSILKRRPAGGAAEAEAGAEAKGPTKRQLRKAAAAAAKAAKQPQVAPKVRDHLLVLCGTYNSAVAGFEARPGTGEIRQRFATRPHTGYVSAVAQSDRWMLSAGSDESVCIYNARKMAEVGSIGSEGTPTKMAFVGNNVLCATATGMLQVYRSHDWTTVWKEQGHRRRIHDVALHPTGALGISVGDDSFMKLWDFTKGKLVLQVKLARASRLVRCAPGGEHFVLCNDKELELHNMQGEELARVGMPQEPHCCCVAGEEPAFIFGLEDGGLVCFAITDSNTLIERWSVKAHAARVRGLSVATNPDTNETALVSVCTGGQLKVWQLAGQAEPVLRAETKTEARFTGVAALWR